MPKTLVRSALPPAVNWVEGRLRPRLFLLLDFRPIENAWKPPCITPYFAFSTLPSNRPKRAIFFLGECFLASLCSSAHRRSVGDTRAFRGGYLFSFFCCSSSWVLFYGFCSMGFLLDRKFWHYPKERFTLLQKVCHVVEVARSRSVLAVPLNLFHKTEGREIFNSRVHGFPIHTALLGDDSPRGKAVAVLAVAVPEQTAIHGEVPRL